MLKYCRPYADFEVDLLLLSDANVKVGNINHSSKFASQLRPAFAEAVDSRVKDYIQRPLEATLTLPPIGIVADKLTTRRRTGQMFAAVLFTPGMESILTPVSLGVTSVTKHDGDAIAQDIHDVAKAYNITGDQIGGFGFDGQYFNLNVPSKLKEKMRLNESVNYVWDPAHKLQLADHDMRREIGWVDDVCKDIGAVLSKFKFGKTFEAAIHEAARLHIDFRALLWFSETRFATYAYTVFRNFLNNYGVVRRVLEDVAASNDSNAQEADNLLRRIRSMDFLGKLLICTDFYREMGILSSTLQQVNLCFWTRKDAVDNYLQILSDAADWKEDHLSVFHSYLNDLQNCVFGGVPIFVHDIGLMMPLRQTRARRPTAGDHDDDPEEDMDSADVINCIKDKGKALFIAMKGSMKTRFPDAMLAQMEEQSYAAKLHPIMTTAKAAANEDDFMASDAVKLLISKHHHPEQTRILCRNMYRNVEILGNCASDIDIYHHVFTNPKFFTGAHHVLGSIAKLFSSYPPESIVESMGSVIEQVRHVRGGSKTSTNKADVKDISDELKVHWNGPHISHCQSIVTQALNIHFRGGPWHFIKQDVRSKIFKVSKVVDRLKDTKPKLTFMAN